MQRLLRQAGHFTSGSTSYPTSTLTQDTKLYGGSATGWGWASDLDGNGADHTAVLYNLKAGQTYTLTISGRSIRFNLDRIVLRHSTVPSAYAQDPARPESSRMGTTPTNKAPTVSAGPDRTITLPGSASLDGTVSDDGLPAGAAVTVTWTKVSGPGTVTFANSKVVDTTASFSAAGTYVLRLTASDTALSASDDVQVAVNAAPSNNAAPVVSAGPDRTITLPAAASLDGTVTDDGLPVGAAVTVTWTKVSGPGTVTFANSKAVDTTASFSAAGTYVLRLTASDTALSASDDMQVIASDGAPVDGPKVTSFTLVNADSDNDIGPLASGATINLATLPTRNLSVRANATGNPGSVRFAYDGNANYQTENVVPYAIKGDTAGDYNPWTPTLRGHTLKATPYTAASAGGTAGTALTVSFTVTDSVVPPTPVNAAPIVSAGPDRTVTLPGSASLDGTVTDDGLPVGKTVTVTWTKVSGPGTVTFANSKAVDTTATFSVAGTYVLRLTASDTVLSASDDMKVTVNAAPVALSVTLTDDCYLENGTRKNDAYVKVENASRRRISYLRFNVTGLNAAPKSATLTLRVAGDPGQGMLRAYAGSHSNWTESNLTGSNAPAKGKALGTFNGTMALGQTVKLNVTSLLSGSGAVTVILDIDKGTIQDDVWFSSKEGGVAPVLTIQP